MVVEDLAQWLRAQLDTDVERATTAAEEYGADWYYNDDFGYVLARRERDMVATGSQDFLDRPQGEHIAEWDPARVLREIDAKRKVLAEYEQADRYSRTTWGQSNADQSRARTLGKVVRLLASVYSDRPGYREEWAPAV